MLTIYTLPIFLNVERLFFKLYLMQKRLTYKHIANILKGIKYLALFDEQGNYLNVVQKFHSHIIIPVFKIIAKHVASFQSSIKTKTRKLHIILTKCVYFLKTISYFV